MSALATQRPSVVPRNGGDEEPLLVVEGIDASYGPLQVLFGVDLEVPQGGLVALLGTNGAGKSTVLKVIAGLLSPDSGTVRFRGEDVTGLRPDQLVRRGITLVQGGQGIFPSLTVTENLRLGAYQFLNDDQLVAERLDEVFDLLPQLRERDSQRAGTLSGGEQQMVLLGRALVARAQLLMIDELSLGLAPVVMAEILRMITELVERGTTLLLVEQSLNVASVITELAYFMEKGEVRFSGPPDELMERGDLVRSIFLGRGPDA